jgi:class 3 adenylate cyclase/gamma-glutamylcyclotransferase (GGCT)/AIG2-like uncharacterized protein YtfP
MGATSSRSIDSLSKEEVAALVSSYGEKYQVYSARIVENGVDGELLASLSQEEFQETLDELEITARLHRRKLQNEFKGGSAAYRLGSLTMESMCSTSCGSSVVSNTDSESSSCTQHSEADSTIIDEFEARLSLQSANNRILRKSVSTLRVLRTQSGGSCTRPTKKAALVFTDIEGSTPLWEANPRAMRKALDLHNKTIRKLIPVHGGYEYNTEGDAFAVAFHEASDAIAFALAMQVDLNKAAWSEDILSLPWARDTGDGRRGLRVRVSVHMGNVKTHKDAITGITKYSGEAVEVAKSVEGVAAGGQIMVTFDAWNAAAHLADCTLGSPMVANMGVHTILQKKNSTAADVLKRIVEVAPSSLNIMGKPVEA